MGSLILLMGPTGAGKSVQGDMMAQDLGGVHLSSGALLFRDPKVAAMLADGRLASPEEVHRIVGEAFKAVPLDQPIILDGTPRTMSDVMWLDKELPSFGRELKQVILLELDIETSLQRLAGRDRSDDAPEAVSQKYRLYQEKTQPVVSFYEKAGQLERIDGRGSIEEVHELIKAALA